MSDLEYGSDSAPEDILAIALSNRAEEMIGFKQTVAPEPFKQLGMRLNQDYVAGKAGYMKQSLGDITSRIDAGDYFDEEIQDILDSMQMSRTKEMARQQDPDDVGDLDLMFDKFLDEKDKELEAVRSSDNVIPLDRKD